MLLTWCLPVFIPCANDSNQLIELFMEYDKVKIPEDILEKMTNLCQNVTTDLKLKQDSFNSGKFCIIQIVINQCSSESAEFVNTNYEKLVNMLTVKPDGETCAEPFHEFHSQQCLAAVNRAKFKIQEVFGDEQPSFFDERWPQIYDICEKAKVSQKILSIANKNFRNVLIIAVNTMTVTVKPSKIYAIVSKFHPVNWESVSGN
uniref:DUF19 domain-containing protein n=1 Tax=Caenorhabditis tropicalis TaxID=1561998 RepID=A0A1I7UW41_9PELO